MGYPGDEHEDRLEPEPPRDVVRRIANQVDQLLLALDGGRPATASPQDGLTRRSLELLSTLDPSQLYLAIVRAAVAVSDAERGFLVNEILPNADRMEAAIHVLDQKTVANYLSHDASSKDAPTIITGTGCDDVNYKLNWMNQMVLQVLPAGPEGPPRVDYETVREGCDYRTRAEATRGKKNENENRHLERSGGVSEARATIVRLVERVGTVPWARTP